MKVLVCGGCDFTYSMSVFSALDQVHQLCRITEIVHGGAKGADALAARWAKKRNIPATVSEVDWIKASPDAVVAFHGGDWTDMICDLARKHNVPLLYWQGHGDIKEGTSVFEIYFKSNP